eukprot:TRINITY_DN80281_c0_g1_i1.p1 TRINITY_DN80281_c0_g1~~TRINITY_DN80281_c0_g1_i1.p1  ORF type:complete len:177 (+),score=41.38 TRINITY_DN80281_c0_g1_i1:162-692(+)
MEVPEISLIVAVSRNGVIGKGGHLPWRIPEDWKFFLDTIQGTTTIMGRVCHEDVSDPKAFGAEVVVLTGNPSFKASGCTVLHSFPDALAYAVRQGRPISICGGHNIYKESLGVAKRLFITEIEAEFEGDTYFPLEWKAHFPITTSVHRSSDKNYSYTFITLEKEEDQSILYERFRK